MIGTLFFLIRILLIGGGKRLVEISSLTDKGKGGEVDGLVLGAEGLDNAVGRREGRMQGERKGERDGMKQAEMFPA